MRRSDREITDITKIEEILDEAEYMTLSVNTDAAPYAVPLSFGCSIADGDITLYFHCAKEGHKLDLLGKDNRVGVAIAVSHGYVSTGHGVTADYKSVIGSGEAVGVFGDEMVKGLELLLKHCNVNGFSVRECAALGIVAVYKVTLKRGEYTAKGRF